LNNSGALEKDSGGDLNRVQNLDISASYTLQKAMFAATTAAKNVISSELGYPQHPFHSLVLLTFIPDTVRSFLPCGSQLTTNHVVVNSIMAEPAFFNGQCILLFACQF
jgi:hypothetical protein